MVSLPGPRPSPLPRALRSSAFSISLSLSPFFAALVHLSMPASHMCRGLATASYHLVTPGMVVLLVLKLIKKNKTRVHVWEGMCECVCVCRTKHMPMIMSRERRKTKKKTKTQKQKQKDTPFTPRPHFGVQMTQEVVSSPRMPVSRRDQRR
jgi:hypothetical protein